MTANISGATPPHADAQGERHPAGLPTLFFTEMWERFSYYGMRALLVLYLVNALGYARADALAVYGTYTALVYLTPIAGGWHLANMARGLLLNGTWGIGTAISLWLLGKLAAEKEI